MLNNLFRCCSGVLWGAGSASELYCIKFCFSSNTCRLWNLAAMQTWLDIFGVLHTSGALTFCFSGVSPVSGIRFRCSGAFFFPMIHPELPYSPNVFVTEACMWTGIWTLNKQMNQPFSHSLYPQQMTFHPKISFIKRLIQCHKYKDKALMNFMLRQLFSCTTFPHFHTGGI